jgi:hypothetical protein
MRAFEVYINRKKVCLAGIGDDGVLTSIVDWVTKQGEGDLLVTVGGLVSPVHEHVTWVKQDLCMGDEVTVKIVETDSSDVPATRTTEDPSEDLEYQKSYVRAIAKKLGWKIQAKVYKSRHR